MVCGVNSGGKLVALRVTVAGMDFAELRWAILWEVRSRLLGRRGLCGRQGCPPSRARTMPPTRNGQPDGKPRAGVPGSLQLARRGVE